MHERPDQKVILGLDLQELSRLIEASSQPPYRAQQLFQALYREHLDSTLEISTLPKEFRSMLVDHGISVGLPEIQ
jgi:23S rRNA (adenine2503-C2)-methyltransferase